MTREPTNADVPAESRAASLAVERQVNQWRALITSTASRYGIRWADLDDLLQDIRVRVWRAQTRSEKQTSLPASYMYNLVRSAAMDYLRRRRSRREEAHVSLSEAEQLASSGAPAHDAVIEALDGALAELLPERRLAVRLHLDGKHLTDVAELLGWSEAKARNLLYRGLDDLKRLLERVTHGEDAR